MCNLHWCYTFCTGVTLFALVLHLNCTALSQSESSNFFMCIIINIINLTHCKVNCYSLQTIYPIFEAFQILFPTASLIFKAAKLLHQVIRERTFSIKLRPLHIHKGSCFETLNLLLRGVTLALAHSPRQVSKVSGERKSSITRPFGEYDFFALCFTFHFAEKTSKHKPTISILQSFIFPTV